MPTKSEIITVQEAAEASGVTPRQVRNWIAGGLLAAEKHGRDYMIRRADLAKVPKDRKPGPKANVVKKKPAKGK